MNMDGKWTVNSIEVENFRCFDRLQIDFDPEFNALVGVNGTGKTAILDVLAVMLSTVLAELAGSGKARSGFKLEDVKQIPSFPDDRAVPTMELCFPVRGTIDSDLAGQEFWWTRERRSRSGRTSWGEKRHIGPWISEIWNQATAEFPTRPLPVMALYGVERLFGVRAAHGAIGRSRRDAYSAALESKSDLTRLSSYIKGLTIDEYTAKMEKGIQNPPESRQLEAIRQACSEVLIETGWEGPYWRQGVNSLTMSHPSHGELPLSSLSSGLKIAAGLAIDLASRMARANPSLGQGRLLATVPGIVLIDEIDLHLHPTWQQRIVGALRGAFPRVQFIVTTHSPQVLSTVPAHQVRVLNGSTVERVNYSEGLRSDVVLREVMGTNPSPSVKLSRELLEYQNLVDAGRGLSEEAKAIRRKLDNALGGVANVPSLATADALIAFYDDQGES